jgi:pilus assembly protein CpaF
MVDRRSPEKTLPYGMSRPDGCPVPDLLVAVRRRLAAAYPDLLAASRVDETARESVKRAIRQILISDGLAPDRTQREEMIGPLFEEIAGYGPLDSLLADPEISEVMVNGDGKVYAERRGRLERADVSFRDAGHVLDIIGRMLGASDRRVDLSQPYVDARLPDGSRLNAVVPPVAVGGPVLTLRRFGRDLAGPEDLVRLGALPEGWLISLRRAVEGRLNVVVCGGASSGKTTFLNVLATYVSLERERVITIEDAAELRLGEGNLVRLECRPANIEGRGLVSQRELLRNALRMRPDRIIVGECRGAEAFDMLGAMNTGHPGSMTTVHANGPADALRRLEVMVLMAGEGLPYEAVRDHIASAVDVIVHLVRRPDGLRQVAEVGVVRGYDRTSGSYDLGLAAGGEMLDLPLSPEQTARMRLYGRP